MPSKQDYANSQRRKKLGLAWCSGCKQDRPQAEFEKCPGRRPFGLTSLCRACNLKRKANVNRKRYWSLTKQERYIQNRRGNLKKCFGITLEQYDEMLKSQQGVCAICKQPESEIHHANDQIHPLVVDHNKGTKVIRGLLCTKCNKGIGLLRHNPEYLLSAAAYLVNNEI